MNLLVGTFNKDWLGLWNFVKVRWQLLAIVMLGNRGSKQNVSSTRACSSAGSAASSRRRYPRTRRTQTRIYTKASFSFTHSVSLCFGVNWSWCLDGDFIPNERLEGATNGGCFGNGPSMFSCFLKTSFSHSILIHFRSNQWNPRCTEHCNQKFHQRWHWLRNITGAQVTSFTS